MKIVPTNFIKIVLQVFGQEEKANELIQFMKNKRKVEEKITCKRGIPSTLNNRYRLHCVT